MKRFFSFLLFLLTLAVAVASTQMWMDRRQGVRFHWEQVVRDFVNGTPGYRRPEKYTVASAPIINVKEVNVLAAMSQQRVALARAVLPSVVSVTTSKVVPMPDAEGDPFAFFHRNLPRGGMAMQRQLSSGAVVSKEGHIVTNNHVIEGMEQIEVELNDGRRRPARLVGRDVETDIAILKIDAGDLQPLPLGDSDAVEVGETIMAVGNPYGLEESVSQGIIAAKGRRGSENTSDLFQTDAQINPGNSGGPLINVRGELIGINEAIYSETGHWEGVGFAIPSATVRRSMDAILKLGRVMHGYLGIQQRPLDRETSQAQGMGGDTTRGVVVDSVVPGSPADKATIRPGDVIEKFNGKAVRGFDDLKRGVSEVDVDASVPVEVLRNGKAFAVTARIAEKPAAEQLTQLPHYPDGQR